MIYLWTLFIRPLTLKALVVSGEGSSKELEGRVVKRGAHVVKLMVNGEGTDAMCL